MDPHLRNYLIMMAVAAVSATVLSAISFVLTDGRSREYAVLGSIAAGAAIGLIALFLIRKKDIFYRPADNICLRLQEISTILTFLAAAPTVAAVVTMLAFPNAFSQEIPLISGIMIFASMLVQAFFWRKVATVGYLSGFGNIIISVALILMNLSALLAINFGGPVMLLISVLASLLPIILMFNWSETADMAMIMTLISAAAATVMTVLSGGLYIGEILVFWIPAIIMFLYRNSLKGTSLAYDGQRLF